MSIKLPESKWFPNRPKGVRDSWGGVEEDYMAPWRQKGSGLSCFSCQEACCPLWLLSLPWSRPEGAWLQSLSWGSPNCSLVLLKLISRAVLTPRVTRPCTLTPLPLRVRTSTPMPSFPPRRRRSWPWTGLWCWRSRSAPVEGRALPLLAGSCMRGLLTSHSTLVLKCHYTKLE